MCDTKYSSRPQSPVKVLWFEFLLNPATLEKHLSENNPDPSATELIIQFLANSSSSTPNEQNNTGNNSQPFNSPQTFGSNQMGNVVLESAVTEATQVKVSKEEQESKKTQALKLLALKVAAFLKWELNLLEKKLPLTMQQTLIMELLKIAGIEIDGLEISPVSFKEMTPDAQFARILYYSWVLRAVIEGSYPVKGQKGLNVQIPGQADPSAVSPTILESIMRKLNEQTEQASLTLEEFLQGDVTVRMPLIGCFGSITEELSTPNHQWDQGFVLKKEDVVCQVSYDLGRFYFFQEKYDKASKHFITASELYLKLQRATFCKLNASKLKGFYDACAHLLGYQSADSSTPLRESLQTSAKAGHTQTVNILMSDNLRREIPLSLRDAVEINIVREYGSKKDLHLYTAFLNAVRRTLDGQVILTDWCSLLKANEERASLILCEVLKSVITNCSSEQIMFLKNFVRMVCLISAPAKVLFKKSEILSKLFSHQELEELLNEKLQTPKIDSVKLDRNFTDDPLVQIGLLERGLLSTRDASAAISLITQLRALGNQSLWSINQKWELPRAVSIFLKSVPGHVDQETIQILLAKTAELRAIKKYGEVRQLYRMIDMEIRGSSARLSRFLNWELLRLDLLEVLDAPVYICQPSPHRSEIVQRILACIASFNQDREIPPDTPLLELCAAVLLNFREWDILMDLESRQETYFEFSRIVAAVCKDVFLNKGSRSAPRELWEIILPIFNNSTSSQHKRSGSGIIKDIPREASHAIMTRSALQQFVKKLKDTLALGVMISCLAKLYNILKDDSNGEIFLEYQVLWPTVTNCGMFNMLAVSETFQDTLHHALSVHPTHSSWLRTKGDLMYVQGHYSAALKFYLSAAMVSTDFFNLPLPRVLFDDLQYKHMIHCCTKLQNHTQSAVLCQLLEDCNYTLAFKALGERVCNDSCDVYYSCIWDVTLLEFLINLHTRRGELDCRQIVMQLIGQLELNSNNNEEIQREAANLRKGRFLRAMAKQYL